MISPNFLTVSTLPGFLAGRSSSDPLVQQILSLMGVGA